MIKKALIFGLVLWLSSGIGAAQTPNPVETATGGKIVALADNGKTITIQVNETFLLKLGEGYDWNITIDDQTIINRVVNVMVVRGAQGLYEAHKPGSVTLTAFGDPICRGGTPPCAAPSQRFILHIIVKEISVTPTPASSETSLSSKGDGFDAIIALTGLLVVTRQQAFIITG